MKKIALIIAVVLFSLPAFAHKISAFVDVEGNKVSVMSYFNDGTPVKNGKVEVYDEKTNKLILTGKTNSEGEFSFTVKKPSDYKVVVVAELGHKTTAEIKQSEFGGISEVAENNGNENIEKKETSQEISQKTENPTINTEELKKIIREELNNQLKPIHQKLLDIDMELSKVSFKDIFAGIGWILGIFGAAALVYSRKQNGK
ncbi:carboxypeptidase-like regulatory domain-containing protein [Desulfurobacterium thermolithotrophum]|uniref:carboxypeptidase-like regulatory domain-containing protein n=1 Tax=Desulfurobacterium thermolithotrophum TaxID=64160 RepID=UPI0013D2F99B|nr:carboxypeptidase-like regulatory domain-containing protein [Desulfurobacterium thermolithotrophum]